MITELQPRVIVLQLTDALFAQLRPFMAGLDITASAHGGKPIKRTSSTNGACP